MHEELRKFYIDRFEQEFRSHKDFGNQKLLMNQEVIKRKFFLINAFPTSFLLLFLIGPTFVSFLNLHPFVNLLLIGLFGGGVPFLYNRFIEPYRNLRDQLEAERFAVNHLVDKYDAYPKKRQ